MPFSEYKKAEFNKDWIWLADGIILFRPSGDLIVILYHSENLQNCNIIIYMEIVKFQTTDGITIVSDFSLPESPKSNKKAVLLLHMMPEIRSSWIALSKELNYNGFTTLVIDLRGHGDSTNQNGKKLNYKDFTDQEHQASRLDVDAALNFLKSKGFNENSISVVGASIGANLALDAMSRYSGIMRGVLLSPGLDYRGVKTEPAIKNLTASQKIWIVTAQGDSYSTESTKTLVKLRPDIAVSTIFKGAEHGTNLFQPQPDLIQKIVNFLNS